MKETFKISEKNGTKIGKFSEKELKQIKELHKKNVSTFSISKKLNRNMSSIRHVMKKLNLNYILHQNIVFENGKKIIKGMFLDFEIDYLKKNFNLKTYEEMSEEMFRDIPSIQQKMRLLGLKKKENFTVKKKNDSWQKMIDYANTLKPGANFGRITSVFSEFGKDQFLKLYKLNA